DRKVRGIPDTHTATLPTSGCPRHWLAVTAYDLPYRPSARRTLHRWKARASQFPNLPPKLPNMKRRDVYLPMMRLLALVAVFSLLVTHPAFGGEAREVKVTVLST